MIIMEFFKNKSWTVIILLALLFVIIYNIRRGNVKDQELQKEYPTLKKETRINGDITFKYDFKANNYRDFLSISRVSVNGEKFSIIASGIKDYSDYGINEVIEVGDFISKEKNNDTILIKKNGSKETCLFLRRNKLF
jgi:hypothetical protein